MSKFSITDNRLYINDNQATQAWLIRFLFIFNILNSGIQLTSNLGKEDETFFTYFWIIFAALNTAFIIWYQLKLSDKKRIELAEIASLNIRSVWSGTQYRIKLKNGKRRPINLDSQNYSQDLIELEELCSTNGIELKKEKLKEFNPS